MRNFLRLITLTNIHRYGISPNLNLLKSWSMNFIGKSAILMVVFYVFRLLFLPHQSFAQERKVQVNFIFEVSLWASSSLLEIHLLQNNILISGSTGMPVETASAHKVSTEKRLALLRTFVGDRSRTDAVSYTHLDVYKRQEQA